MEAHRASLESPRASACRRRCSRARSADRSGQRTVLLLALGGVALALGVATYGVASDHRTFALIGLVDMAAVAAAMAISSSKASRARAELLAASEELQRRNAELETLQIAIEEAFAVIDERTQGRLRELLEEAGDELAALVEEALDDPTEESR